MVGSPLFGLRPYQPHDTKTPQLVRPFVSINYMVCWVLDANDTPDVQGGGEGKHQTGKQNGGCCPLKLPGFPIIKVCSTHFDKEKYGEDQINGREDHVVDHSLDLGGCGGPGALYGSSYISAASGQGCACHQGGHGQRHHQ